MTAVATSAFTPGAAVDRTAPTPADALVVGMLAERAVRGTSLAAVTVTLALAGVLTVLATAATAALGAAPGGAACAVTGTSADGRTPAWEPPLMPATAGGAESRSATGACATVARVASDSGGPAPTDVPTTAFGALAPADPWRGSDGAVT